MPDDERGMRIRTHDSVRAIPAQEWDALVDSKAGRANPFVSHAFLSALENSGSVGDGTSWRPAPLVAEVNGEIAGVAPLYVKHDSAGEYVFDHGWADAYERAGGRYFPKLLVAAPFTPAAGPRLLARDETWRAQLASALTALCAQTKLSSAHVNFVEPDDERALAAAGFLPRDGIQYHWLNRGYSTYDDFLGAFASRKRKAMKRERREAVAGIQITRIAGSDATEADWDALWAFYQDTGARKWGRPYLTRAFFDEIAATMRDATLLVLAKSGGRAIAGALNFIGGGTLYGRYWGAIEQRPFLHFEVCYHQAIEFAIERGLRRVEAGAQGEHKLARGYEPTLTRSMHFILDPRFREAVARFLEQEQRAVAVAVGAMAAETPYRADCAAEPDPAL
jgi:hypothetical protein